MAASSFNALPSLAMIPSSLTPVFIRLDRTNYFVWKTQILPTVGAHGLEGILTGSDRCPPPTIAIDRDSTVQSPNPAYEAWCRLDRFLVSWLFTTMTETMVNTVCRCKSACEIWSTLQQLFSSSSKSRIMQLKTLIQTIKKGSMSIDDYILKIRCLADSLMAAGQIISDDDIIMHILSGLGPEYESVVVNLSGRDSVTIPEVQFSLQSHEMRIENFHSHVESNMDLSHPSANYVSRRPNYGVQSFNPGNSKGNTGNSGFNGSFQQRNSTRGNWNRGNRGSFLRNGGRSSPGQKYMCQLCGKSGHTVVRCYYRFDQGYKAYDNGNSSNNQNRPPHQAFLSSSGNGNQESSDDWFFDSGATDHVSPSDAQFAQKFEYQGDSKLAVGNGSSLPINSIGQIHEGSSSNRNT